MEKMEKCPICGSPAKLNDISNDFNILHNVDCIRCGKYEIEEEVIEFVIFHDKLSPEQIANISGWIRENQNITIDNRNIKSLMTLKTPTVSEKATFIIKYLAKQFTVAGTPLNYNFNKIGDILNLIKNNNLPNNPKDPTVIMFRDNAPDLLPLVSIGRIIDSSEFSFIWEDYLINEKKYISKEQKIKPAGWAYLESLRQANPESKKAFVAMWFDTEMEKIYDGFIAKAIEDSGFKPIQIGRKEHNNDINDEIIGEIKNSKFVVADFTGNRGGVYYEAGFAYGLNIPVIHTCKKDQLKKVHFDVNHRKIIKWKDGDDLYEQLLKRIKATIA